MSEKIRGRRPTTDDRRPTTDDATRPVALSALPDGWQMVLIRDKYIFTQKPRNLRYTDFDTLPFVPMEFIPFQKLTINNYLLKKPNEITSGTYFEVGDLLLPKITPSFENGKQGIASALPNGFGVATTEVIPIKHVDGVSDIHFLFYYLLKDDVRRLLAGKMEGSTGRQRLSRAVVEALEIPFPPLPEQRAIARVLATIQRAVEAQDQLIAATRAFKRALMRHLFTYGAVPPADAARVPLKDTEIGAVPVGWEVAKIGDVAIVRAGIAFPPRLQGRTTGRYPFFKVSDMNLPSNNLRMRIANNWVDSEALNTLKAEPFPPDTIIFPKVGGAVYTNKKRMLSCAALIDNNVMGVSVINDQCHAEYLFYWLTLIDIRELSNPGPLPSINAGRVKDVFFPLPPLAEQRAIARILTAVDAKIAAEEKRKAALQTLFKTMLHQLMTGQIRVNAAG